MANSLQAKKRIRQSETRVERNTARRTRLRGVIKSVEQAIDNGDHATAATALAAAQPEIMRSVTKGVMHKNTASRKISRLSKRVNALRA